MLPTLSLILALDDSAVARTPREQRYHAIVAAHDNAPLVGFTADGSPCYRRPDELKPSSGGSGTKGFTVVDDPPSEDGRVDDQPAPVSSTGCLSPEQFRLKWPMRDAQRGQELFTRYTSSTRVLVLRSDHTGGPLPATAMTPGQSQSTVSDLERAFHDTGCRIASLRGGDLEGCDPLHFPPSPPMRGRQPEDVVWFHFSGHGTPEGLVLQDGVLRADALEGWVHELVDRRGAALVVIIADACYGTVVTADEAVRGEVEHKLFRLAPGRPLGNGSIAVFRSATTVPEADSLRSGILTHVVLSGLMGGADADDSGDITFAELSSFFNLQTAGEPDFVGRTTAPDNNPERVLLRVDQGDGRQVDLAVDRSTGARLLIAEPSGVVAEINVNGKRLETTRKAHLRIPIERNSPTRDLYFLDLGPGAGAPDGSDVSAIMGADLPHIGRLIEGVPAGAHPPAGDAMSRDISEYLVDTQSRKGLFSHARVPFSDARFGNALRFDLLGGYTHSPAWGRVEDDEARDNDILAYIQSVEPTAWNLVDLGLRGRAHFLGYGVLEARGSAGLDVATRAEGQSARVAIGRGGLGVGTAAYLGTRAVFAQATTGWSLVSIQALPGGSNPGGQNLPVRDRSPGGGLYLAGGVGLDLPTLAPLVLDLCWNMDRIDLDGRSNVPYDALSLRVGGELVRLR